MDNDDVLLARNGSSWMNLTEDLLPGGYDPNLEVEDTNWILTSSFIIFTMQTGFGMLESGCVSIKNEVNIMMKNVVDIVLGGLTYWMFGYGLSFGKGPLTNPFIAIGGFCIDPSVGNPAMGPVFAAFLFQLSFATTATTIVSGAMAERTDFKAYCIFSLLNTLVYCIPAGWVWGEHGFLYNLGAVDIAGSGPVHLIGGSAAFASAAMLGPRIGRYSNGRAALPPGSPVNAVLGLFVLWWGWLAFNSGSTYGVSGAKWQFAARAAVMTMIGSFGGGIFGLIYSLARFKGKLDLIDLINSVLGALVSITAGCFLYHSWEALLIGVIGGAIACLTMPLVDMMKVDDPVGASSVHGFCGIWGVIAVGLFADNPAPLDTTRGRCGLFKGGGWYLLGVQTLTVVCLTAWGLASTALLLWIIGRFRNIRMTEMEELLGADVTEHMIRHGQDDVTTALNVLEKYMDVEEFKNMIPIGSNPGHKTHMLKKYADNIQSTPNGRIEVKNITNYGNVPDFSKKPSTIIQPSNLNHEKLLTFNPQMQQFLEARRQSRSISKRITPSRELIANELPTNKDYRSLFYIDKGKDKNVIEYSGDTFQVLKLPRINGVESISINGGSVQNRSKNNRKENKRKKIGIANEGFVQSGWID